MAQRIGPLQPDGDVSPSEALGRAASRLRDTGSADPSLVRLLPKLASHLEAQGVVDVRSVGATEVRRWIDAPLPGGRQPSVATRHTRRLAARIGFRTLREEGVVDHDPLIDLGLPYRDRRREARPLTDGELRAGRAASVASLGGSLRSAAWALAEATATNYEIPRVLPEHVDIERGAVRLSGSRRVDARDGSLTAWGRRVVERRLGEVGPDQPLAYSGGGESSAGMQASASLLLSKVLADSGLRSDPGVMPVSVRAWAGRQVFLETGRIEEAARALGCQTLDTAAAIVGLDWRAVG